ncbi:MAG: hypothetical protein HKN16_02980 [Saprospiraceae bacterium]|nr:hypothetical protein [Saprospiraceae bacterium]
MKKFFKPYSLLLFLLVILCFFFLGLTFAILSDAGKNQGLAGGAIVLGYGVISAVFGLVSSLVFVYFQDRKVIISANKLLGFIVMGFLAYYIWNYNANVKPNIEDRKQEMPAKPTRPTDY